MSANPLPLAPLTGSLSASSPAPAALATGPDFAQLLQNAVAAVNEAQNTAQQQVQAFTSGASEVSLEEVMVSVQKANLSLQGMIAVRNKLVEAYKDISNLPL